MNWLTTYILSHVAHDLRLGMYTQCWCADANTIDICTPAADLNVTDTLMRRTGTSLYSMY